MGRRGPKPRPALERFAEKFALTDDDCWLWLGCIGWNGYGLFNDGIRTFRAHRWIFRTLRAEIPEGLDLDHLCRNRACVNPWHLEPVTRSENLLRGVRSQLSKTPEHIRKRWRIREAKRRVGRAIVGG